MGRAGVTLDLDRDGDPAFDRQIDRGGCDCQILQSHPGAVEQGDLVAGHPAWTVAVDHRTDLGDVVRRDQPLKLQLKKVQQWFVWEQPFLVPVIMLKQT